MNVVRPALLLVMGSFMWIACTDAGGTVQGGDPKIDTNPPPIPVVEAGAVDGGFVVGTGIAFADLYNDYFGRLAGGPGCAGDGTCHGAAAGLGAMGSGGFVCPSTDKDACYMGIMGKAALLSANDKMAPRQSYLVSTLRHLENGAMIGSMPKRPATYVFTETDIVRISNWIAAGAQNN